MPRMTFRSTYALDEQTVQRVKRLARAWGVSQAEVIRRSIRLAASQDVKAVPTPAEVVARYASQPLPRNWAETQRLIESMRALRHEDDEHRAGMP